MKNDLIDRAAALLRIQCEKSRVTEKHPVVPVITGPTASGKTDFSQRLSEQVQTLGTLEIVSADAFQIFRGMDIGTAKPDASLRARLPHHLIDILEPDETYSVGKYIIDAVTVLNNILCSSTPVVVCGGTGLYIEALVNGLHDAPAADETLRAQNLPKEKLLEMLKTLDTEAAEELKTAPLPRITRAVEIVSATGKTLKDWRKLERVKAPFNFEIIELTLERAELYRRIEGRVDEMMERGLVGEVESLRRHGIGPGFPSQRAIGYREIHRYLDGESDLPTAVSLLKRNTRRYAKRQLTWWRHHG